MTRLMKSYLIVQLLCIFFNSSLSALSSLANNDPYPIYNAYYDFELTRWQKEWIIGCNEICDDDEIFSLAISPFSQKARSGRDFAHTRRNLGDLTGPWNMLGMLYGGIPEGESLQNTQLGEAKFHIFSDLISSLANPAPISLQDLIISATSDQTSTYVLTDSSDNIGFFSVPIHYRKVGVRFEASFQPFANFGLTVQAGVSEIRQTVTGLIDLTPNIAPQEQTSMFSQGNCPDLLCGGQPFDNNFFRNIPILLQNNGFTNCDVCSPNPCTDTSQPTSSCTNPYLEIENQLMDASKASLIFNQIGFDDCNFEKTSFEDVRFIVWWREIFEINRDRCSWPYFLFTPSVEFNFVIPTAKKKDPHQLYSLPFGNNGFWSIGFDSGISIDFVETVEIAFYGGMNYFFPRDVCDYRIPTDLYQQGIFPFATNVNVSPGYNFNWRAVFNAYHFVDRVSAYVDWVFVKHETDKICPCKPDPAFTPDLIEKAECITKFMSQFVDVSIYYDISPNLQLGVMAQFPVAQRNAYRATTWLGTFRCVF
jgi:hypothetical protein